MVDLIRANQEVERGKQGEKERPTIANMSAAGG